MYVPGGDVCALQKKYNYTCNDVSLLTAAVPLVLPVTAVIVTITTVDPWNAVCITGEGFVTAIYTKVNMLWKRVKTTIVSVDIQIKMIIMTCEQANFWFSFCIQIIMILRNILALTFRYRIMTFA